MKKKQINGILLLYRNETPNASNMFEHIHSFNENSKFPVWELNTPLGFPEILRELEFRVIILHYSLLAYLPFTDDEFWAYLAECPYSYKVAFLQDEYRFWPERTEVLNRLKVDCVYTCFEPEYYQATYGKHTRVPRIETYLPGYVSEGMVHMAEKVSKPDAERTIDVGYRGRLSPEHIHWGKGALEKYEIGVQFREKATGQGLSLDIETEENKRIYGDDWLKFLGNCRAVLGVEGGVSIVDVDNEIFPRYDRFRVEHPEASLEEAYKQVLAEYDGKGVYYRSLSPRTFESAATRTCQILFEGHYSGILKPMVHYIPLKKDFSNFDEVLHLYKDKGVRQKLTKNCYRDLIASGEYSYKRIVEKFDMGLIAAGIQPGITLALARQVTEKLSEAVKKVLLKRAEKLRNELHEQMQANVDWQVKYMEGQKKATDQLIDLQFRYMEQQKQLQELSQEYSSLLTQSQIDVMEQQKQYQQLSEQNVALQEQYMEQQKLLQELSTQHAALQQEHAALQQEHAALQDQYNDTKHLVKVVLRRIFKRAS